MLFMTHPMRHISSLRNLIFFPVMLRVILQLDFSQALSLMMQKYMPCDDAEIHAHDAEIHMLLDLH